MIYLNEIDPYCAAWLQNLMDAGVLPAGHIDTRSIEDVTPNDLAGYSQCHFFAGLGGWIYALDLAGWPRDRPVWTGSCPCQPFSAAGKGAGFADERHLWPAWQHLIAQCGPATVFGEQVASKNAEPWIDLVHADMEGMGYAFGCVPFPAAGIGAPHIRDRNYWVAHAHDARLEGWQSAGERAVERPAWPGSLVGGLAHADGRNASAEREQRSRQQRQQSADGGVGRVADSTGAGWRSERAHSDTTHSVEAILARQAESGRRGAVGERGRLADTTRSGRREECTHPGRSAAGDRAERLAAGLVDGRSDHGASPLHGFWRSADWLACRDGKWRPVEPGTFPLAHGIPGRVGRLRAYGNAIVPQAAAEFVASYLEATGALVLERAA